MNVTVRTGVQFQSVNAFVPHPSLAVPGWTRRNTILVLRYSSVQPPSSRVGSGHSSIYVMGYGSSAVALVPLERSTTMYFAMLAVAVYVRPVAIRVGTSAVESQVTRYVPDEAQNHDAPWSKVRIGTSTAAPDLSTYDALNLTNANASGIVPSSEKSMSTLPFHG